MEDNKPSVITVRDEEGRLHFTSPDSEIAKRAAEREAARAAEVPEPPRGGAGSSVDVWLEYADSIGVTFPPDLERKDITRDLVIAAVDQAREEADAAESSGPGDDRDPDVDGEPRDGE